MSLILRPKMKASIWHFVIALMFIASGHHFYRVFDKFQVTKTTDLQPFRIIQPTKWKACTYFCKIRPACAYVVYNRLYHVCYLMDRKHEYQDMGTIYSVARKEDWNMVIVY